MVQEWQGFQRSMDQSMPDNVDAKAQGLEVSYELHSLGWRALQNLCTTIMAEVFGQTATRRAI